MKLHRNETQDTKLYKLEPGTRGHKGLLPEYLYYIILVTRGNQVTWLYKDMILSFTHPIHTFD